MLGNYTSSQVKSSANQKSSFKKMKSKKAQKIFAIHFSDCWNLPKLDKQLS